MTDVHDDQVDRSSNLYHYTSGQGLDGILSSRSIWATDAAFLNDWREITYAAEPLIDRLESYVAGLPSPDPPEGRPDSVEENRSIIANSALGAIKRFIRVPPSEHRFHYIDGATYVACLTEDYDQLGQWRGYGKSGYAIGFDRESLGAAAPILGPVRYGRDAVETLCAEIIAYFENRRPTGHPGTGGFFDAVNFCMPRLAFVKHAAFAQEREWRLVHSRYNQPLEDVQVRTSPTLIPYVQCPFDDLAVREIVIGPGGDLHSERAVRALLQARGYRPNEIAITQSRAPFRG